MKKTRNNDTVWAPGRFHLSGRLNVGFICVLLCSLFSFDALADENIIPPGHWPSRSGDPEKVQRLPEQGGAEGEVQHVRVPDGWVERRVADRRVDPPEILDVHEAIAGVGEKMGREAAHQWPGQQTEQDEIEQCRENAVLKDAHTDVVLEETLHIG